ncbi:hypothetical protein [Nocardioides dongkuii]|uniref:hypothetical protein n=1 Tax=Nocardioides dongkuii TaxID=2760089 RepID=UPI0015FAD249|nr:hypothetical protein [Nocardioides dongkuii]
MLRRALASLVVLLAVVLTAGALAAPAGAAEPVDDYADYQPQKKCSPRAKAGTEALGRHLVSRYGGAYGGISRGCTPGSTSEHQGGRAFDWTLDAASKRDRRTAKAFLRDAFATDRAGNPHARARRMGIMYVIWDDRIYSAWNEFRPAAYLSSGCRSRKRCSKTLRHRDHVHVSLSRAGGKGRTSWYDGRL